MDDSMHLIVCTFDGERRANEVREALQALDRQDETIKIGNIAIIRKDANGQIAFSEAKDHRAIISEITGAVAGGLAWFLYTFAGGFGGPPSMYASTQVDEAVARRLPDTGFPDDALQAIGERLDAGESALIALVSGQGVPAVLAELARLGGTIIQRQLPPDVVAGLQRAEAG
jgi:uncharacterized membrane protein